MKISPRSEKLAGLLSEKIPELIHQYVPPDESGFLTVTAIEVSGDLGVADVFVRSLGPSTEDFLAVINKHKKKISHELLKSVSLRRHIELRFKKDKSVDHVEKIYKKLK